MKYSAHMCRISVFEWQNGYRFICSFATLLHAKNHPNVSNFEAVGALQITIKVIEAPIAIIGPHL